VTPGEVISLVFLGLFYFVALLLFVRALLKNAPRPLWRHLRLGVFVERLNGHHDDEHDEHDDLDSH
jgi:hypothetical protein